MHFKHWGGLLAALQAVAPEAHMGGGAIRDTLLDRPIKDIDIFMHAGPAREVLEGYGYHRTRVTPQYICADPEVAGSETYEAESCDCAPHPVNIIYLTGPIPAIENLYRFDFGICQIVWDGNQMMWGDHFHADAAEEKFTLLRCESHAQFDASMKRYNRLIEKYAGWQLVVPEQFKQYEPVNLVADDFAFIV